MTGPEHYAKAERLISTTVEKDGLIGPPQMHVLTLAQVHATLALAAATADLLAGAASTRAKAWMEATR